MTCAKLTLGLFQRMNIYWRATNYPSVRPIGGMDVSDARRPKALEDGNAKQEAR